MSNTSSKDYPGNVTRLLEKYPDKVPIILERSTNTDNEVPELPNKKFLVPRELQVAQFLYTIRKRVKLDPSRAIYLFFGNGIPAATSTMGQVYDECHNRNDGILHGTYTSECTFG